MVAARRSRAVPDGAGELDRGVTWEVAEAGGGRVGADGEYTAPAAPGVYTVVAGSGIDRGIKGHAVVVVGDDPGTIDPTYDFTTSPVQPGAMLLTSDTGCIRGQLLNRDLELVSGVPMHLYRLTEAAGRAWEQGARLEFELPAGSSRQAGGNVLESHRATTVSTGYGHDLEPTNNYTFGTTPPGYYVITTEVVLPGGQRAEVVGTFGRVFVDEDTIVNVLADQSPTVDSAELRPGQTRTLGVYTAAVVRDDGPLPATGLARVHVVGLRTRFPAAEVAFDGGLVTLSVAVVDGLAGFTTTPVPTTVTITGPDGFAQTVALAEVALGATAFPAGDFAFPADWQFLTGTANVPANLTNATRVYTATVPATYGVAGAITESAATSVQALNQPADPPVVRGR